MSARTLVSDTHTTETKQESHGKDGIEGDYRRPQDNEPLGPSGPTDRLGPYRCKEAPDIHGTGSPGEARDEADGSTRGPADPVPSCFKAEGRPPASLKPGVQGITTAHIGTEPQSQASGKSVHGCLNQD
ncbi:uncharacterized protein EV420DRAFT_1487911 [Desarmillaria tabescens]|uniref:Uncharacterized protein n=1 Tax=Armillaria tabescens TaxID=1929756 RepID=A0AA39J5G5_ARMTA|nr:uncharacterized protein EV420DRAFT_1487911 [Desarmillaria tabescens]KAK0435596.1 hypothetical protein EV420DRAFT_1487911 [Desarmillaria tabescens]